FFFFFQAEDGIRDPLVTGVQTCALPILAPAVARRAGDEPFALRSGPAAGRTRHRIVDRDLSASPSSDLREAQLELHARIAARRRPATPTHRAPTAEELLEQGPAEAPAAPEERLEQVSAEDVLDIPRVGEPGPVETFAAPDLLFQAVRPELA